MAFWGKKEKEPGSTYETRAELNLHETRAELKLALALKLALCSCPIEVAQIMRPRFQVK